MEKTHLIGRSIEKELFINAPPQRVFQALTEKEDLERWFVKKAEVDLRPGGAIRFEWGPELFESGKILVLDPPHRLSYTWGALEPSPTTITFELAAENDGTRLHLIHTGIGFGFSLSPLAVAIFSATPPHRAGLGSSMFNTTRQVGLTLSVAVLGTFVLQQFSSNILSQLIQRGVPASISAAIANKVAAAGAQASQSVPSGRFAIPPAALHQALNQAFGDALHGMFIISGIAVLAAALLAAFSLQQGQARTSGEGVSSQATTATQGAVAVNAEER